MKSRRRFASVFYRLVASYLVLVIITVLVTFVSMTIYMQNYNQELVKANEKVLNNLKNTIQTNVLEKADSIYTLLTARQSSNNDVLYFFDFPEDTDLTRIGKVSKVLKDIVFINHSIIDSIEICYGEQFVVSSFTGYTSLTDQHRKFLVNMDWLDKIRAAGAKSLWIEPRKFSYLLGTDSTDRDDVFTFVKAYPFNGISAKGYIAVNIKKSVLIDQVRQMGESGFDNLLFVDKKDAVILQFNEDKSAVEAGRYGPVIDEVKAKSEPKGSYIHRLGSVNMMVSYVTMGFTGWKAINKSINIQRTLIVVCVLAIAMGFISSNLFTMNIYKPLRSIHEKSRKLTGLPDLPARTQENEFLSIDSAISYLSAKADTLEENFQANLPLIKHGIVVKLLNQKFNDRAALDDWMKLLGGAMQFPNFAAIILRLRESAMRDLSVEESQLIRFEIIRMVEAMGGSGLLLMAIEISENELAIVANMAGNDLSGLTGVVAGAIGEIAGKFSIASVGAVGTVSGDPLKLHLSYLDARTLLKYAFFMPGHTVFSGTELLDRENHEKVIPNDRREDLLISLKSGKWDMIESSVRRIVSCIRESNASADSCRLMLQEAVSAVVQYHKSSKPAIGENAYDRIHLGLNQLDDIAAFEDWLLKIAHVLFVGSDDASPAGNYRIIQKVKEFVAGNIHADISLQMAADRVCLTPHYLSRVFKEVAGMNFTQYVTEVKLKKARELLLTTDLQVEEIAEKLGYNSTAYFIKLFKKVNKTTPSQFRRS